MHHCFICTTNKTTETHTTTEQLGQTNNRRRGEQTKKQTEDKRKHWQTKASAKRTNRTGTKNKAREKDASSPKSTSVAGDKEAGDEEGEEEEKDPYEKEDGGDDGLDHMPGTGESEEDLLLPQRRKAFQALFM